MSGDGSLITTKFLGMGNLIQGLSSVSIKCACTPLTKSLGPGK